MSIADKLQKILDSKENIRVAIENKGGDLTGKTFENDWATEIEALPTGGGLSINGVTLETGIKLTENVSAYDLIKVSFDPEPSGADLEYETPHYGWDIWSIYVDDNYIYAGGSITRTVRVYEKGTGDYVYETTNYDGIIHSIWVDDNYIYAGGRDTQTVRAYIFIYETLVEKLSNFQLLSPWNADYLGITAQSGTEGQEIDILKLLLEVT